MRKQPNRRPRRPKPRRGPRASGAAISRYPPPGRYRLWWECLRKLPYTRKNAFDEVIERNRRLRWGERDFNAYKCIHCGKWHVGHVPKEEE